MTLRSTSKVLLMVNLLVLLTFSLVGCSGTASRNPAEKPLVAPPAISKAATLKVGVALGSAPYAVEAEGGYSGFDVEVAQALASKLNLTAEFVAVAPDEIAQALQDQRVDIVLSAPEDEKNYQVIGQYIERSMARYGNLPEGETASETPAFPLAVQKGSPAYWYLKQRFGDESYKAFDSIADAVAAVEAGELDEVLGDSVVLAYAVSQGAKLSELGKLGDAQPIGIAVGKENTELASVIQGTYDAMQSAGVLDSLKRTWFGVPPASNDSSGSEGAASETP